MATTTPAETQLYPLSTRDGVAIPLDIVYPVGLIKKSFTAVGVTALAYAGGFDIVSFFSEKGCIVQFGNGIVPNPLADGTKYLDSILIPPGMILVSAVPTVAASWSIVPYGSEAGVLWIQGVRKWAGLALQQQIKRK